SPPTWPPRASKTARRRPCALATVRAHAEDAEGADGPDGAEGGTRAAGVGSTAFTPSPAGRGPGSDGQPVMRRALCLNIRYAQIQLTNTAMRLRNPTRYQRCTSAQNSQAAKPDKCSRRICATARARPM